MAPMVARVIEQGQRTTSDVAAGDRCYRVVADPIVDDAGAVKRVVLIVTDVTEYRKLEADLRRRAEQLAELDRRKDEFLGMLAHELRNPLNAIAAANSLMDRVGAQDARNVRLRTTVRRQTRHLARLVDDLLEVSRVTRGKMHLQREPADLVAVLKAAIENTRPLLDARGQRLQLDLPIDPLPLNADSLRLEQVFNNLLSNALKFNSPGGRVDVRLTVGSREVEVLVSDTGIGIPGKLHAQLFDKFNPSRRAGLYGETTTGLGLFIARQIVELHGGAIWFESREREGTTFFIELA